LWPVAGVVILAVAIAGAASAQAGGPNPPQPIVVFPTGSFPESLAVRAGDLYVYLGFAGEVVRVTADGSQTRYASGLPTGSGLRTGLALDKLGNLYVAAATFASDPAPGVFMIPPGGGSFTRVLTLAAGSFPNGLAFHGKYLYVSDSDLGAIWRLLPTGTNTTLSAAWYQNPLLAPEKHIGANGIAFDAAGSHLYVAVADQGRIVRLALAPNGSVRTAAVLTSRQRHQPPLPVESARCLPDHARGPLGRTGVPDPARV